MSEHLSCLAEHTSHDQSDDGASHSTRAITEADHLVADIQSVHPMWVPPDAITIQELRNLVHWLFVEGY